MSKSYLPPKAPLNDPKACASFMGLKPSTTKSHLVRAILESIAFRWVWPKRSVIFKVAQLRHVREASFRSLFAETSSSMRRCWGKPTSPSQRSGTVSHQLSGNDQKSHAYVWISQMIQGAMLYPDTKFSKNSSPQTLVVASLIRKPPQISRILPVCWTLCFSLLLKLMLCWAFNVCMETQRN